MTKTDNNKTIAFYLANIRDVLPDNQVKMLKYLKGKIPSADWQVLQADISQGEQHEHNN